jgi:Holliday junction resolvase RusA-like endonuclease
VNEENRPPFWPHPQALVSFFVEGRPKSTQTGTVIRAGGRMIPIRRNTEWSSVVGLVARQYAPTVPYEGPLLVTLDFRLPRPQGGKRFLPSTRPDLENLSKGLTDSFSGVLFHDDAQVVMLLLSKGYGRPGVYVQVLTAKEEWVYETAPTRRVPTRRATTKSGAALTPPQGVN